MDIQNHTHIRDCGVQKNDYTSKDIDNNHIHHNKIVSTKNVITGENNGIVPKGSRMQGTYSSINGRINRTNQLKSYEEKNKSLKYNNYSNNRIPKTFYDEFFQNPTGIPPLSDDALNPSPIPFSGPIPFNKPMNSHFQFSGMNDVNNQNFPTYISKKNQRDNNNLNNNKITNLHFGNQFRNNEIKKEISSDALDNLFDFHIGKELDPEPEVILEKKK